MLGELATRIGLPGRIDMAHHVEMKLAARIRHSRTSEATLVLNNITCGERPAQATWPLTCARLLPRVLRPGQRLNVVGPGGWTKTYVGGQQ